MRVLVYDRTCVRTGGHLSPVWATGSVLYRTVRRIDAARGVASWAEALDWIAGLPDTVHELQYWGHGKWGSARAGDDILDATALAAAHPLHQRLHVLKARLAPNALVWFRTCETLGARPGIAFAEQLADFLGAHVAGHTYVIGFHQSGLHRLAPGARATWSPDEGLADGSSDAPVRAKHSRPWAPHTITALHGAVPDGW